MTINIRQKGANGEREIANELNLIVARALSDYGLPAPPKPIIQRNQNQSAVGGGDLSNAFGLSIEIKRQESLAVNTWWVQCVASANRNAEIPVLIYRKNKARWSVVIRTHLDIYAPEGYGTKHIKLRSEISWEDFLTWFYHWVCAKINHGEIPRI